MSGIDDIRRDVRRGDPILSSEHNAVRGLLARDVVGPHVTADAGGWATPGPHQEYVAWTYLIGIHSDGRRLVGQHAYFEDGSWRVFGPPLVAPPQPGFSAMDFADLIIVGDQPTQADRSVLLVADHFMHPGAGATTGVIHGKVVAVSRLLQQALLVTPLPGVNPADDDQWANDANFDVSNPVCCWTMGYPVVDVGWAGLVFSTSNGNWLMYAINFVEDPDFSTFCEPAGRLSPASPQMCPELSDDSLCGRKACVNLTTRQCRDVEWPWTDCGEGETLLDCLCDQVTTPSNSARAPFCGSEEDDAVPKHDRTR